MDATLRAYALLPSKYTVVLTNRGFMCPRVSNLSPTRGPAEEHEPQSPPPVSYPWECTYKPGALHSHRNMGRDRSSWTGKHPDGVISHQSPRANVTRTDHGRILSSKILGGHTENRMFRNIFMTECSSPVSLSECTSRSAAVSVRDSRLGWDAGAPGLPAYPPPPGSTSGWSET